MEALLQSLAAKYGFDYAKKLLGLDKQKGNPKYTFGMPLTNNKVSFNPMKMISNQFFKNAISGGKMSMGLPLLAAGLGLAYMRNPLREGSMNYNPELQGQINYLSGMDNNMIGKDPNSGLLKYGPDSVLRNKNVVSMFGTNDYAKSLQNYIDKMEARKTKGFNTIGMGPFKTKTTGFTDFQQSQLDKAKKELNNIRDNEIQQELNREVQSRNQITRNLMTQNNAYTGGGGDGGQGNTQSTGRSDAAATGRASAAFRMARGGIASL